MINADLIHHYHDRVFKRQAYLIIWICWVFRDYEASNAGLEMFAIYEAEARRRGMLPRKVANDE
jgi:hypothetical protein